MGNQQERLTAWFAGILDGEGCISFQVYTMPSGLIRITPFLCITNSDAGVLKHSQEWLDMATKDARFGKPRICKSKGTNKPCITIRVDGVGCRPVLEQLLPYLRSDQKRRSAEVVLEFFASRDKHLIKRDARGRIQRDGYTRAEVELVSSIRTHKAAKSSEAICRAPNVIG